MIRGSPALPKPHPLGFWLLVPFSPLFFHRPSTGKLLRLVLPCRPDCDQTGPANPSFSASHFVMDFHDFREVVRTLAAWLGRYSVVNVVAWLLVSAFLSFIVCVWIVVAKFIGFHDYIDSLKALDALPGILQFAAFAVAVVFLLISLFRRM
jgi:hypothetical protein